MEKLIKKLAQRLIYLKDNVDVLYKEVTDVTLDSNTIIVNNKKENEKIKVRFITKEEFESKNLFSKNYLENFLNNFELLIYLQPVMSADEATEKLLNEFSEDSEVLNKVLSSKWYKVTIINTANLYRSYFEGKSLSELITNDSFETSYICEDFDLLPKYFILPELCINGSLLQGYMIKMENNESSKKLKRDFEYSFKENIQENSFTIVDNPYNGKSYNIITISKNIDLFKKIEGKIISRFFEFDKLLWILRDHLDTKIVVSNFELSSGTWTDEYRHIGNYNRNMVRAFTNDYELIGTGSQFKFEDDNYYNRKTYDKTTELFSFSVENKIPLRIYSAISGFNSLNTSNINNFYQNYLIQRQVIKLVNEDLELGSNMELFFNRQQINFYELHSLEQFMLLSTQFCDFEEFKILSKLIPALKLLSVEVINFHRKVELKRISRKVNKIKEILNSKENVQTAINEMVSGILSLSKIDFSGIILESNHNYINELIKNKDSLIREDNGSFIINPEFAQIHGVETFIYEDIFEEALYYEFGFYENTVNAKELRTLVNIYSLFDNAFTFIEN